MISSVRFVGIFRRNETYKRRKVKYTTDKDISVAGFGLIFAAFQVTLKG